MRKGEPIAGQTVEIRRPASSRSSASDGHTSFWDELGGALEGAHKHRLAGVDHVEIRNADGTVLESLPVTPPVKLRKGRETVFFPPDAE